MILAINTQKLCWFKLEFLKILKQNIYWDHYILLHTASVVVSILDAQRK